MHELTDLRISKELSTFFRNAHENKLDALHDAFISLWSTYGKVDLAAVRSRANHRMIDAHRKSKRTVSLEYDPEAIELVSGDRAVEREESIALREAISELPMTFMQTIQLHFFENRSPGEIALQLHCPRNTVYSNIRRGIELLRKHPVVQKLNYKKVTQ